MGCDWYTVESISACGVIIDEKDELLMKIKEKIEDNNEYNMMLFKQCDETNKCFVYKKETETFNRLEIPGPYEIDKDDNVTKIVYNEKMTNLLKNDIKNMEEFLNIKDCKYLNIVTTFGIGLLKNSKKSDNIQYNLKYFSSIEEYNDWYGYEYVDE